MEEEGSTISVVSLNSVNKLEAELERIAGCSAPCSQLNPRGEDGARFGASRSPLVTHLVHGWWLTTVDHQTRYARDIRVRWTAPEAARVRRADTRVQKRSMDLDERTMRSYNSTRHEAAKHQTRL